MTRRPSRLARRSIPVAVPEPVQLSLGLRWDQPIDRVAVTRDPEPIAARKARAA